MAGGDVAAALREAMVGMIGEGRWTVEQWGAFVVYGLAGGGDGVAVATSGEGEASSGTRAAIETTGFLSQITAKLLNHDFIKISNLSKRELYVIVEEDPRLLHAAKKVKKASASGEIGGKGGGGEGGAKGGGGEGEGGGGEGEGGGGKDGGGAGGEGAEGGTRRRVHACVTSGIGVTGKVASEVKHEYELDPELNIKQPHRVRSRLDERGQKTGPSHRVDITGNACYVAAFLYDKDKDGYEIIQDLMKVSSTMELTFRDEDLVSEIPFKFTRAVP